MWGEQVFREVYPAKAVEFALVLVRTDDQAEGTGNASRKKKLSRREVVWTDETGSGQN